MRFIYGIFNQIVLIIFDINIEISSLIDHMTLNLDKKYRQTIFNNIAKRSANFIDYLTEIDDKDFKNIANHLKKIGSGLQHIKETISKDTFSKFSQDIIKREEEDIQNLEFPTDAYLEKIISLAEAKIGGKSKDTIMHFINDAKNGDKKSLWYFYEIIRTLKLEE